MKDVYVFANEGSSEEYLTMDEDPRYYDSHRKATEKDMTTEAIAAMLDQDAEFHNAACSHWKLAAILVKVLGKSQANKVMVELIQYGGLHGLKYIDNKTVVKLAKIEI